jgi:hypothetical protein
VIRLIIARLVLTVASLSRQLSLGGKRHVIIINRMSDWAQTTLADPAVS